MASTLDAETLHTTGVSSPAAPERVGRIFGGVLLVLAGLLVAVVTIAAWHWFGVLQRPNSSQWTRVNSGYGLSFKSFSYLLRPWHLALAMLAGSGITYSGLCLILTRRRSETGLALLLLWGIAAWLILQTTMPVSTFTVEASFKTQLTRDDVQTLGNKLAPRAALATLPEGLRAELELPPDGGLHTAEFNEGNQPGVTPCVFIKLIFKPETSVRQQALLANFYTEYLHRLAVPAAIRAGNQARLELFNPLESSGPDWLKWREAWLHNLEKEMQ